jgi:hypothetical protein
VIGRDLMLVGMIWFCVDAREPADSCRLITTTRPSRWPIGLMELCRPGLVSRNFTVFT